MFQLLLQPSLLRSQLLRLQLLPAYESTRYI
jgi:hypothetical protein